MYLFVRFSLRLQNCPLGSNSNGPFRKYTCAPMYSNLFQGDFSFFVRNPTRSHQQVNKLQVGMTGFEPAASWSQTRRSSQTEPHPDVLQHHFYEVVVPCALKNFFSLAQGKSYYIIWSPICQHLFYKFLYFFRKKM